MLDISLGGLVGAIVGTIVAGVNYHLFIGALDRWVRERERARPVEERDSSDMTMPVIRRVVLTIDLLLFAGIGYWVGDTVWG